jgi:hypothetical protein
MHQQSIWERVGKVEGDFGGLQVLTFKRYSAILGLQWISQRIFQASSGKALFQMMGVSHS